MKKLFALILAAAMLTALSVTAFAAEEPTSTITVVMHDAGGDGWGGEESPFAFISLSTDELEFESYSGQPFPKGITNVFSLESGTSATVTHTAAKNEVVYFRWLDPLHTSDTEASFRIYRDGILQYSCDDVTQFDGSEDVCELFFTSYPDQRGMNVTYSIDPTYTVTIPPTVTIEEGGTLAAVSVEGVVVNKGQYVSVALAAENDFIVKTAEGAELAYTVTKDGETLAPGGEILAVNPDEADRGSANITFAIDEDDIQYAGAYTGSATFTIAVKEVSPAATISFTIGGVSYQAEPGMTWAEWVVSDYNTGGFELDINGDPMVWSSDGCVVFCPEATDAFDDFVDSSTEIESGLAYTLFGMWS